ncbi:unnamed protein product [Staurois parvus]|uniref:Uncharacterized protein n=1 Tax=Staurois parvus TaxID=386267 RepID=A0ABN9CGL5_9NEOB|nr:unnamed protein product [Staurois parvus]
MLAMLLSKGISALLHISTEGVLLARSQFKTRGGLTIGELGHCSRAGVIRGPIRPPWYLS